MPRVAARNPSFAGTVASGSASVDDCSTNTRADALALADESPTAFSSVALT